MNVNKNLQIHLSPVQQSLWHLYHFSPECYAFNIGCNFRSPYSVNETRIKSVIKKIHDRHKILNMVFYSDNNQIYQRINSQDAFDYKLIDGSKWDSADVRKNFYALLTEPFNIEEGPLVRYFNVTGLVNDESVFLIAAHQIVADNRSLSIIKNELFLLLQNPDAQLPELKLSYADYIENQIQYLSIKESEINLAYWKNLLVTESQTLDIPTDFNRPAIRILQGKTREFIINNQQRKKIFKIADETGVTGSEIIFAVYFLLLSRLSGQNIISIGLNTDDRDNQNLDQYIVGTFSNYMPLVIEIGKNQTCLSLIERIRRQKISSSENAKYPFGLIAEKISSNNDRSRSPVFQTTFNWHTESTNIDSPVEYIRIPQEEGQFDLSLFIYDNGVDITAQFKYASHLFTEETVINFIERFNIIMNYFPDNLNKSVDEIPLISESEKIQITKDWNETYNKLPENYTLQKLFEDQADNTPDTVAAISGNDVLTYAGLESMSNRIAGYLRRQGIKNNDMVGIYIDRSLNMLAGLLGILKSGAAYVPLDPYFPSERISYIIRDSGISIVLTEKKFYMELSSSGAKCICLDDSSAEIGKVPDERPAVINKPDDLAYVIYTSGSTGQPKGVRIHHEAVVNFLLSMSVSPGLDNKDVFCAITTISFDISVLELFGPLIAGARTVILQKEISTDAEKLAEAITANGVTITQATPATWEMLISSGWNGNRNLRILCGGESLKHDLAIKLLARSKELWNMYGPTETTVWSACGRVTEDASVISVGKPVANTSIYILDKMMRPLPAGIPGNLYIGGKGVSKGYHNLEEMTKNKFIPNPFAGTDEEKIYFTGDNARYMPDGKIIILGRSDFQVKIRGFRIEPGEIESVLKAHPAVNNAVVTAVDTLSGGKILAAYIVKKVENLSSGDLNTLCTGKLPGYMIPAVFVFVEEIPLTPNNKVNIRALPPVTEDSYYNTQVSYIPPSGNIETKIASIFAKLLKNNKIGVHNSFFESGGTSISAAILAAELRREFKEDISVVTVFQYPTISSLAGFISKSIKGKPLMQRINERISKEKIPNVRSSEIAVIGMSGRFPGAESIDELWENILNGKESVTQFSRDELDEVDEDLANDPFYIPARGILTDIDKFDAPFFGIRPNEAQIMDPQQRVIIETAWAAFENAGYSAEQYDGVVGVYAGMGDGTYYLHHLYNRKDIENRVGSVTLEIASEKDHIAPRISFLMNLRGPSLSIHTACSTGLTVVDAAVNALISGQCDIAMAGGIDISVPQKSGQIYQEEGIFTRDGHCRPFDADATGTMFGEAVGVVVLKRLEDAIADNDTVHAVIRGTAVNHDGSHKASYLAPSVDGQAEVIALAQARAGIHPESIGYVEAHGTATPIGDPIEVEALTKAFRLKTSKKQYCALGSIKGNLGHTTNAAGITGLIKAIQVMKHKKIPPSINFRKPNPAIDFKNSPFFVNTEVLEWPENMYPARAGVSSFGYCGTNVHAVLEEFTGSSLSSESRQRQLIMLSAKTASSLNRMTLNLCDHIRKNPGISIADAAYTLQKGRNHFNHRKFVICSDAADAVSQLEKPDPNRSGEHVYANAKPRIVFLFPGQGSQYVNMGRTIYRDEPLFREIVDSCAVILKPHIGLDIRDLLFPLEGDEETAMLSLKETRYTQPAIFIIEYALSSLWRSWGINPDAMIGHSIGEFVCACLAGIFSLEDALRLVAGRGRLMQDLPRGTMLSVLSDAESIEKILPDDLSLAAINGPKLCVVSGPTDRVSKFEEKLKKDGIITRELHSSHAFHSVMMDPIVKPFEEIVRSIKLAGPRLPFVSTVTGRWITPSQATDPSYWANHLRATVKFSNAISEMLDENPVVFLEVGPRSTSATLARQQITDFANHNAIASLGDTDLNEVEWVSLLKAVGKLWQWGINIDLDIFYQNEKRKRIPLPTYSFEKIRYWVDYVKKQKADNPVNDSIQDVYENQGDENNGPIESKSVLMEKVWKIMEDISGKNIPEAALNTSFVDLGFDSLILTQIARNLTKELKVQISFRQIMENYPSISVLAEHIRTLIPEESLPDLSAKKKNMPQKAAGSTVNRNIINKDNSPIQGNAGLESIIIRQMNLIERLVTLLEKQEIKPGQIRELLSDRDVEKSDSIVKSANEQSFKKENKTMHSGKPPVAGAKLGKDENGNPAWYIPDQLNKGKYIKLDN